MTKYDDDQEHRPPEEDAEPIEPCANCGTTIRTNEWHPATIADRSDTVEIKAFCDRSCREEWQATADRPRD